MYAQLCKRLNELVPNFEEPGSQSTTFRKLLLHKCQEEFENRKAATALYEGGDGTGDQEDQRALAKRKMLGNIRFVGELFKIGVLHEAIIHSCIKELLERRKGARIADTAENIECLCHFMTTVGEKLDTQKAKAWMDKYFERVQTLLSNPDLPRRIHFMLQDVLDLRANKWQPRRSSSQPGPRPIHQIRQELYQQDPPQHYHTPPPFRGPPFLPMPRGSTDEGFVSPHSGLLSPQDPLPMTFPYPPVELNQPPPAEQSAVSKETVESKPAVRKLTKPKTDNTVSLRPSTGGLKPSTRIPASHDGSGESAGSATSLVDSDTSRGKRVDPKLPRTRDDSSDEEDQHTQRIKEAPVMHPPLYPPPPRGFGYREPFYPRQPIYPVNMPPPRPGAPMMYPPPPGQRLPQGPPRPVAPPRGPPPRGAPPPRYFHPPGVRPFQPPPRYPPQQIVQPHGFGPPPGWVPPPDRPLPPEEAPPSVDRSEPVKVKYVSKQGKKGAAKKQAKDETEASVESLINQYLKSKDIKNALEAVKAMNNVSMDTLTAFLLTKTLNKSEDDRTKISELIKYLHKESIIQSNHFLQAVRKVFSSSGQYESSVPLYKTYLAGFIARAIAHDVVIFSEVAVLFENGSHHPTLLVVLQALTSLLGEDRVVEISRGVKLPSLLPVEYRSHEALTELLENKKLIFIYPLRRIQLELAAKLRQQEITAVAIYKWIKSNVDASYYQMAEFVMVLTKCILEYVCCESTLAPGVSKDDNPSKNLVVREKELMEKFKVLITRFVSDDTRLQISALYATQTFCHQHNFPKGLLLRMFSNLYSMDVVEEESFLKWKEDLSQEFPGKGRALFQVNQWLVLLAEAEVESSEDEQ